VSEQTASQVSDNLGDVVGAGTAVRIHRMQRPAELTRGPAKDSMSAESPKLAPEHGEAGKATEAPRVEAPRVEVPKADAPKADAPKADAPKADVPRIDAKADAPTSAGRIMVMSRDHAWSGDSTGGR